MDSPETRNLLLSLRRIKRSWYRDPHMRGIINRLNLKLYILKIQYQISRILFDFRENVNDDQFQQPDIDRRSFPPAAAPYLNELTLIKPEMEEIYSAFLNPTKFVTCKSDEYVVSFINLLLENLEDMLSVKLGFIVLLKPEISALEEKLRILKNFLIVISCIISYSGFSKGILFSFAEVVAFNVAYLLHFLQLHKKNMEEEIVSKLKIELLDVVVKINPLCLDAARICSQTSGAFEAKVIIDAGCFMYSPVFNRNEVLSLTLSKEHRASNEMIELMKAEYGGLFPVSSVFKFPTTNELGFVEFILNMFRKRLITGNESLEAFVDKFLLNTVYEGLEALRHSFVGKSGLVNDNEGLRALFTSYKDLVFQAEYFVDFPFFKAVSQQLELSYLGKKIGDIRKEVETIINGTKGLNNAQDISRVSSEDNPLSVDEIVDHVVEFGYKRDKAIDQLVGLEDEMKILVDQLTRGSQRLKILSVVGMPGVGKTTLAGSVYNNPLVAKYFHLRAWCSVSQVYKSHTLLSEILGQITEQSAHTCGTNASYFAEKVYKSLKGNRFLIVIDDIWTIEAWNVLKESFPDDINGSRVIFTTRHHTVASQAESVPQDLRLLSDDESWKLLQFKLFKEETCPSELLQVGKRIARNCKGLPLSVVLTAGLLKKTERNYGCWEQVEQRLRSYDPSEEHLHTLELSYRHLPEYLEPCFLYFGSFPEDTEIPARKLLQLWIAEGFVQPSKVGPASAEDKAGNYLNDLVDRSLVMIAKRSSLGGAKACRIHDIMHEFCMVRAKQESFMLAIDKSDKSSRFHDSEVHQQYRLCIGCNSIPPVASGYFESRVRTLLISKPRGINQGEHTIQSHTPSFHGDFNGLDVIKYKFRLLRVLDLGTIKVEDKSDFVAICGLVNLRFLSLVYTREIPKEISDLKSLETFVLEGPSGLVSLPDTVWDMASLRHLHVGKISKSATTCCHLQYPRVLGKGYHLDGLASISTMVLHLDDDIESILRMLPSLRKLGCIFSVSLGDSRKYHRFPVLDFLNHLESLKISFSGKVQWPWKLNFPSNLKSLTHSEFQLPWEAISAIGELPNLEVLKLLNKAFAGKQWNMKGGDFQRLKFLKLDQLDIAVWDASSEHLPLLEQLVLNQCKYLVEVPSDFGEILTLKNINVTWCNPSLDNSVRNIQEEEQEMGNDQLNVYIYPPIVSSFITGKDLQPPKGSGKMYSRLQRRAKTPSKSLLKSAKSNLSPNI